MFKAKSIAEEHWKINYVIVLQLCIAWRIFLISPVNLLVHLPWFKKNTSGTLVDSQKKENEHVFWKIFTKYSFCYYIAYITKKNQWISFILYIFVLTTLFAQVWFFLIDIGTWCEITQFLNEALINLQLDKNSNEQNVNRKSSLRYIA